MPFQFPQISIIASPTHMFTHLSLFAHISHLEKSWLVPSFVLPTSIFSFISSGGDNIRPLEMSCRVLGLLLFSPFLGGWLSAPPHSFHFPLTHPPTSLTTISLPPNPRQPSDLTNGCCVHICMTSPTFLSIFMKHLLCME